MFDIYLIIKIILCILRPRHLESCLLLFTFSWCLGITSLILFAFFGMTYISLVYSLFQFLGYGLLSLTMLYSF